MENFKEVPVSSRKQKIVQISSNYFPVPIIRTPTPWWHIRIPGGAFKNPDSLGVETRHPCSLSTPGDANLQPRMRITTLKKWTLKLYFYFLIQVSKIKKNINRLACKFSCGQETFPYFLDLYSSSNSKKALPWFRILFSNFLLNFLQSGFCLEPLKETTLRKDSSFLWPSLV